MERQSGASSVPSQAGSVVTQCGLHLGPYGPAGAVCRCRVGANADPFLLHIYAELGVSQRTFARRLSEEGLAFSETISDPTSQIAIWPTGTWRFRKLHGCLAIIKTSAPSRMPSSAGPARRPASARRSNAQGTTTVHCCAPGKAGPIHSALGEMWNVRRNHAPPNGCYPDR